MVKCDESFHAQDMFDQLIERAGRGIVLIGLVRPHAEKPTVVQLARGEVPGHWMDIPESVVSHFEPLSMGPVADGAHLVRLYLKEEGWDATKHNPTLMKSHNNTGTGWVHPEMGAQWCYIDSTGKRICRSI